MTFRVYYTFITQNFKFITHFVPKASKEDILKVKIQARALYEIGKHTQEQICETIKKNGGSLSRKTLIKWINEDINDIWQVQGISSERQLEKKQQIKTEVIPPIVDKIIQHISDTNNKTEGQDKRGMQLENDTPPKENPPTLYIDEITANKLRENAKRKQELADILTEGFLEKPEMLVYQTAYLGIQRNRELLLNHKTYYEGQEEKVGYQVAKNMEQLANSTFKYAEILGVVTKAPKIAIQNNNTTTQEVKVEKETPKELAIQLLSSAIPTQNDNK